MRNGEEGRGEKGLSYDGNPTLILLTYPTHAHTQPPTGSMLSPWDRGRVQWQRE